MLRHRGDDSLIAFLDDHPTSTSRTTSVWKPLASASAAPGWYTPVWIALPMFQEPAQHAPVYIATCTPLLDHDACGTPAGLGVADRVQPRR